MLMLAFKFIMYKYMLKYKYKYKHIYIGTCGKDTHTCVEVNITLWETKCHHRIEVIVVNAERWTQMDSFISEWPKENNDCRWDERPLLGFKVREQSRARHDGLFFILDLLRCLAWLVTINILCYRIAIILFVWENIQ